MPLPDKLPIGTVYWSTFHGYYWRSEYEGKLTYRWGAKGHCGMDSQPIYTFPILGGHVCEYVLPDKIMVDFDAKP